MLYTLAIHILFLLSVPLQGVIGVFIAVTSGFPVFFRQKRIGCHRKPFMIYKFRTMKEGAQSEQLKWKNRNESSGPTFKIHNDPRFTRLGKFLSHTGLDELPQLYNVLRGEMALIGPRPFPVAEANQLALWMREREIVLPGIISPAILSGKYHENFTAWMKSDIAYARTKNSKEDLLLMVRSIRFLIRLLIGEFVQR